MSYLNLLPWWGWFLCGIVSFFVARFIGRIADEHSSTPAEIGRLLVGFAGVVCIVIAVLLFIY
ncbi:MAG: hypothetical protein WAO35_20520 [Terriglobia bacterium]